MWSVAGVHDMGWAERAVFGKIRYMNLKSTLKKFDVPRFIAMYPVRALPAFKPSECGGAAQ
jgi:deoxyribodipyrimidine photo-lyase